MLCLDRSYQTQALEFLLPAFSLYPDKDYCVITQPHTASNSPFLGAFTVVPQQPTNTFSHVLYLVHRAALAEPPKVRYVVPQDLNPLQGILDNFDADAQEAMMQRAEQHCIKSKKNKAPAE